MSEQGKQINLQNLYETVRAERDQYQQKCRDLERLLETVQKDWKKKYEELKRLRTKLAAVREVYELAREHVPMGHRYGHDFGVVTDRLGQILGIRNVDPDEDLIKELQKDPQMALRVLLQAAINRRD